MTKPAIIVIGASKGGVQALTELVSYLPATIPAALFIVLHSSPGYRSHLDEILAGKSALPVVRAGDGEKIAPGTVYVARENRHLLVKEDHVLLPYGPRENRVRPSIDALFRSAAAYHTSRVTAVLLTGLLDDGVSGLAAVKRCGGRVIVQDPKQAEAPDLPENAIRHVEVDHILPIKAIAEKLVEIAHQPAGEPRAVPEEIMRDIKVSEHTVPDVQTTAALGELTPYTCPACGGVLREVKDEPKQRLICHTGHSFTMNSFLSSQGDVIENSLWEAIRFIQERVKIIQSMAEQEKQRNRLDSAADYQKKVEELNYHVGILRGFILSGDLVLDN